jgi:hypothetical protein
VDLSWDIELNWSLVGGIATLKPLVKVRQFIETEPTLQFRNGLLGEIKCPVFDLLPLVQDSC